MLDAFKVSILVKVTNEASAVLGTLNKDFLKSEKAAYRLTAAMKDLKLAFGLGAVAGGLAFGLEKALKPAMEYQHQVALTTISLNNQKDTAKAIAASWKTAKDVLTSTPTENLKVLGETKFAFGDLDNAIKALPQFMKISAIIGSVTGQEGIDQAFDGAKLQELRGSVRSDADFSRQMEAMARTTIATGGKVGPEQFYAFAKMSAPFLTKFSDQFLYNEAPTLMQDMSAPRAGTAINTLLQAVVAGRMTKASFATAQSIGLIDKDAKYRIGSAGTIQLEQRQFHGADLAEKDPLAWVQQVLMPAMSKMPERDRELFLTQLFSNRNAQRPANDFLNNDWRYIKDAAQTNLPKGIGSLDDLMTKDPETAQRAAAAQWNKLWTQIGIDIVPKLVPLIAKLAEGLDHLTTFAARHPTVTKLALELGIALTALLAFSSGIAILSAALKATGIAGLVSGGAGTGIGRAALTGMGGGTALGVAAAAAAGAGITYGAGQLFPGMGRAEANFKMWVDHMMTGSAYTPLKRADAQSSPPPVVVQIDGRTIATVLSRKQADMLNGPSMGSSLFDPRQSFLPAAY